ncbi:hypothetical protein TNCV_1063761 [Trichonephila clavipes]|nr:hypothetical protein TNCV_1063761 [Trichonephila clavipes]
MLPGSSASLTVLFHGCGSHLKLLKCEVDDTGEVVLKYDACRRQIYRPISKKGTGAPAQQLANQFLAASGISRSAEKLLPDV